MCHSRHVNKAETCCDPTSRHFHQDCKGTNPWSVPTWPQALPSTHPAPERALKGRAKKSLPSAHLSLRAAKVKRQVFPIPTPGFPVLKGHKGVPGLPLSCWEMCKGRSGAQGLLLPPRTCAGTGVSRRRRKYRLRSVPSQCTPVPLPCTSPRPPRRAEAGTRHLSPRTRWAAAGQQT